MVVAVGGYGEGARFWGDGVGGCAALRMVAGVMVQVGSARRGLETSSVGDAVCGVGGGARAVGGIVGVVDGAASGIDDGRDVSSEIEIVGRTLGDAAGGALFFVDTAGDAEAPGFGTGSVGHAGAVADVGTGREAKAVCLVVGCGDGWI